MEERNPDRIAVIAHRGGSDLFQENSLRAFKESERLGVDAVECDVHLTRDKKLVVMHDSNLSRTTGVDKRVSDFSMEELREIKLLNGDRIPTLEDVFDEVSINVIIELKSPETMAALLSLFKSNPTFIKRCGLISFFHDAIMLVRKQIPEIQTGALLAGFPVDPVSVAKSCGADILSLNFEGLTTNYVDRCHLGKIKVAVWTPNTEEEIEAAIKAEVDFIASDRPDIVIKKIKEIRQ